MLRHRRVNFPVAAGMPLSVSTLTGSIFFPSVFVWCLTNKAHPIIMKHLLPYLDRLEPQASEMLQLVIDLCNINSGTFHLAGLDRVRERLIQAFSSLEGEIETIPADPYMMIDDEGNQDPDDAISLGVHVLL